MRKAERHCSQLEGTQVLSESSGSWTEKNVGAITRAKVQIDFII